MAQFGSFAMTVAPAIFAMSTRASWCLMDVLGEDATKQGAWMCLDEFGGLKSFDFARVGAPKSASPQW